MTIDTPELRLQAVRDALLALHKALVDSERIGYEEAMGPIPSPNHFLKLLTSDPWFAWLQPLARLIVSMDTALDAKEPLTPDKVQQFLQKTREILVVSEEGDGFPRSYFEALQRDPDVVFAHARVASLLR